MIKKYKELLKEKLHKVHPTDEAPEDLLYHAADTCLCLAEVIKAKEPYATTSINELKAASETLNAFAAGMQE